MKSPIPKAWLAIIIFLLFQLQSCIIILGEKIINKPEISSFVYSGNCFTKLNKTTFSKINTEKLYIIKFFKYNCVSHNELLLKAFNEYEA